jgi:integrase
MDEFKIRIVPRPWNKGKLVGQKAPLKLKEIWAIRVRLQVFRRTRELALFNLGIDSKLRACDLLKLRVRDIFHGERIAARAIVVQQKTSRPVQFEITESTRTALTDWIKLSGLASDGFLFPSRVHASPHLSTRQYARIVDSWVEEIGLDPALRNPFHPPHQAIFDLSADQESARCAAPVRPHEAREHGSLPGRRGRGRLRVSRADRGVTLPG